MVSKSRSCELEGLGCAPEGLECAPEGSEGEPFVFQLQNVFPGPFIAFEIFFSACVPDIIPGMNVV